MHEDLISLARRTIADHLAGNRFTAPTLGLPPQACFVSLKIAGKLRGCIGSLRPTQPNLEGEVQVNAVAAAMRDHRFSPVEKAELDRLRISIDLLSPGEAVNTLTGHDPGRYGLIVRNGSRCGVLLPDIPGVETAEKQVNICLDKAGIGAAESFTMERFVVDRIEE